jgi:hypothetical protein
MAVNAVVIVEAEIAHQHLLRAVGSTLHLGIQTG